MGQQISDVFTVIGTLLVILLIFVGAYYVTKLMGRRESLRGSFSGKVKIIDKTELGQNRCLLIVEVAGKTLLLGVTAQHVEKIEELDSSLFPPEAKKASPAAGSVPFSDALKKALKNGWSMGSKSGKGGNLK